MEISRIRALRGPNLWCRHTAIEAIVMCTDIECSIDSLAGFEARLRARFPELSALAPDVKGRCVSLADALATTALHLQAAAGCPVTFCHTTQTIEPGTFQVVVQYGEEPVGKLAFTLAEQLVRAALDDTPFPLAEALQRLRDLDEDVKPFIILPHFSHSKNQEVVLTDFIATSHCR